MKRFKAKVSTLIKIKLLNKNTQWLANTLTDTASVYTHISADRNQIRKIGTLCHEHEERY